MKKIMKTILLSLLVLTVINCSKNIEEIEGKEPNITLEVVQQQLTADLNTIDFWLPEIFILGDSIKNQVLCSNKYIECSYVKELTDSWFEINYKASNRYEFCIDILNRSLYECNSTNEKERIRNYLYQTEAHYYKHIVYLQNRERNLITLHQYCNL